MRPSVLLFYLVPIIAAAFLATLAGASIGSLSGWGFPVQWKIGGCTNINGGLVCAEEFDNLLFFAADIAFFGLVGYAVVFVGYRLAPRIIERVAILGPRSVLFAALFGSAIALATGFLSSGQFFSPGGFSGQNYGFPLVWKTSLASCPPPCVQAKGTYYGWIFFVGDILFYTTAGYVGLPYWLRRLNTVQRAKIHLGSRRVLAVLALTVIALSAGNYAYDTAYGTGNNWTGYGQHDQSRTPTSSELHLQSKAHREPVQRHPRIHVHSHLDVDIFSKPKMVTENPLEPLAGTGVQPAIVSATISLPLPR